MSTIDARERRYRIAEVSHLTGFSSTTLRYYEHAGVIAPPERTAAGYRLYDDRAIERLRLVARAKELGCTLEEIADLVEAWDTDDCAPVKHRLRALVAAKVVDIDHHIAEQRALATQLRGLAVDLATRPVDGPCDDGCGCMTAGSADTSQTGCGSDCGGATPNAREDVSLVDRPAATPPVACTLTGSDVETRLEEWQTLLRTVARQAIPNGLRLLFSPPAPLAEIARLVDAEHGCCAFFSFTITVDAQGVSLDITAPAEGRAMVAAVFGTAS